MTLLLMYVLGVVYAATLFAVGHAVSKRRPDVTWARNFASLMVGIVPSIVMGMALGGPEFPARAAGWMGSVTVALGYGVVLPALRATQKG